MSTKPAKTIIEIYQTVHPDQPLEVGDERYVDLSEVRGEDEFNRPLVRRISAAPSGSYLRHLITGHRGDGKSTELLRLKKSLEDANFLVAYLDIEQTLDLADVEYIDILVAVTYALTKLAEDNNLAVNEDLAIDIEDWFAETVFTKTEEHGAEITLGADYEAGLGIPGLAKILASLTSRVRSGSATRKLIRQKMENRLDDLLNRIELFVDNVTHCVRENEQEGIVIIVDSLEKMPLLSDEHGRTNHSILFMEHAAQLKAIPCHTIYTVPVSLISDRNLASSWDGVDPIPMVKIATREGIPHEPGRELLYKVISKRVSIEEIFASPNLVYELIEMSGGAIRDLMHLIRYAADATSENEKINQQAAERAKRKLIRSYHHLIYQEDLELLQKVSNNPLLAHSVNLAKLMFNRMVLPYVNEDNWLGLHPAVEQSPTYQAYLDED